MKILFLSIILISAMLFSCGIDEIPVLSKPEKGITSTGDKTFQFYMTSKNGDIVLEAHFRGFEIYYKFFSSDAEGQNELNNQSGLLTIDDLTANNFRRINYYISDDDCDKISRVLKPMIKVRDSDNRGKRSLFTINFYPPEAVRITATPQEIDGFQYFDDGGTVTELPIRRNIADPENTDFFKSFATYKTTDSDVAGIETLDENRVLILLYVLSYGKYNLSETVYSDALCLNWIELEVTVETKGEKR